MNLPELKKSLVDNFDASWHTIRRMVQRDIDKKDMIRVIKNGSVTYCLNDAIKFKGDNITIVASTLTAKIITVMKKVDNHTRGQKKRVAKKKNRSWKGKL